MAQVHYGLKSRDQGARLGRWSLRGRLDWREWDGEFVVRVPHTGETHLLSLMAGEAIKALREGAGTVDEIVAQVFAVDEPAGHASATDRFEDRDTDYRQTVDTLLSLETIGIVRADRR